MGTNETGQVSEDAAKIYEDVYLSALFKEWCPLVVEAANIRKGHRVIDVACGTGALVITVSGHIGAEGTIGGIDINQGIDSNSALASQLGWWELYGGGRENADTYIQRLEAVTPEDIQRATVEYMKTYQFAVVGAGSTVSEELFTPFDF